MIHIIPLGRRGGGQADLDGFPSIESVTPELLEASSLKSRFSTELPLACAFGGTVRECTVDLQKKGRKRWLSPLEVKSWTNVLWPGGRENLSYRGRETCFLSKGITGALLPPCSSRWANCLLNWPIALHQTIKTDTVKITQKLFEAQNTHKWSQVFSCDTLGRGNLCLHSHSCSPWATVDGIPIFHGK